eukprot:524116_1
MTMFIQTFMLLIPALAVQHLPMDTMTGLETVYVIEAQDINKNTLLQEIQKQIDYHTEILNTLLRQKMELLKEMLTSTKNTSNLTQIATVHRTTHPTAKPTSPTKNPTGKPTKQPTIKPTKQPTSNPTKQPTLNPTKQPTLNPTRQTTLNPTKQPTPKPTRTPTPKPTKQPTNHPTIEWDNKCTNSSSKISTKVNKKRKPKTDDEDYAILKARIPDIIKLYSLSNTKDTKILELELLNDPANDLVIVMHDIPKQIQCRSANSYYSNIDLAFFTGQLFITQLCSSQNFTVQNMVFYWISHSCHALSFLNQSIANGIFQKLETTWKRRNIQHHQMIQFLKSQCALSRSLQDKDTETEMFPTVEQNVVVEVIFEYLKHFMNIVARKTLSEIKFKRDQFSIKEFNTGLNILTTQLILWHTNDVKKKWQNVKNVARNLILYCDGISGQKTVNDILQIVRKWKSTGGYGRVAVVLKTHIPQLVELLCHSGFKRESIQSYCAVRISQFDDIDATQAQKHNKDQLSKFLYVPINGTNIGKVR